MDAKNLLFSRTSPGAKTRKPGLRLLPLIGFTAFGISELAPVGHPYSIVSV
jgi:hypothetical protein